MNKLKSTLVNFLIIMEQLTKDCETSIDIPFHIIESWTAGWGKGDDGEGLGPEHQLRQPRRG
jgi:hypothetical protein